MDLSIKNLSIFFIKYTLKKANEIEVLAQLTQTYIFQALIFQACKYKTPL